MWWFQDSTMVALTFWLLVLLAVVSLLGGILVDRLNLFVRSSRDVEAPRRRSRSATASKRERSRSSP